MLTTLEPTISPARLATYMVESGRNEGRALALYIWNARLGEAFHLPIQAVEVALRNRINSALSDKFGPIWWSDAGFVSVADPRAIDDITEAKRRIVKRGRPLETGQVVATLSFGFWVAMLNPRYNPTLWSSHLASAFPHLPAAVNRDALQARMRGIADFRNRISHHEPIFKDNITKHWSDCIEALHWMCPSKQKWIKPLCKVTTVLREKP